MKLQSLETKRHYISDKFVVGIDPAKEKHQAMVLDPKGIPVGRSFSFQNSANGFHFNSGRNLIICPLNLPLRIRLSLWKYL